MNSKILDGRSVRDSLIPKLKRRIASLNTVPALAIVQVGNRPDSSAFIKAKRSFALKIGVKAEHIVLPTSITNKKISVIIKRLNQNKRITGIIIQLPLPKHLDRDLVIDSIIAHKDVDGLTATNVKAWLEGVGVVKNVGKDPKTHKAIMPATARGIRTLLHHYKISIKGKRVVVVGRSMLVGKPIANMFLNEDATVIICHSQTKDLKAETLKADILISATGHPHLIKRDMVKRGAVVIDVGIIRHTDGTLTGDVDFDNVKKVASVITPVPGGVGPMTVVSLFENLLGM